MLTVEPSARVFLRLSAQFLLVDKKCREQNLEKNFLIFFFKALNRQRSRTNMMENNGLTVPDGKAEYLPTGEKIIGRRKKKNGPTIDNDASKAERLLKELDQLL